MNVKCTALHMGLVRALARHVPSVWCHDLVRAAVRASLFGESMRPHESGWMRGAYLVYAYASAVASWARLRGMRPEPSTTFFFLWWIASTHFWMHASNTLAILTGTPLLPGDDHPLLTVGTAVDVAFHLLP